jgi:putative RNA 2'-phosphotransferase
MVPVERLSRFLSFLLRHRPGEYPLAFDRQGFVSWRELNERVQARFPDATEEEIRTVITGSDKQRFEMRDDRVRATYGHSFPVDFEVEAVEPPSRLYHGTARDLARTILREGLKPRGRAYVHLSASMEEAVAVGQRRDPSPAVVVVEAGAAHASGIRFYSSGPLYLAAEIPPRFLSVETHESPPK